MAPPKRFSADADLGPRRTRQSSAKRNKLSAPPQLVEEHSAVSMPCAPTKRSQNTPPTKVSSVNTSTINHDSGPGSDIATHDRQRIDDEADAEYEEESESEHITTLPRPTTIGDVAGKPKIDPELVMAYAKELEAKLHAFLPKLRQANSKLSEQSTKLNMEQCNENEQHIEMNLDLGVLAQQPFDSHRAESDVRLPGKNTLDEPESLLPPEASVTRLLNGRNEQARPTIEVMQAGSVQELPQRPGPLSSS